MIISVISWANKAYSITNYLTICLATFDLLFAVFQLVERKFLHKNVLESVSHMVIHGSASCLMLLLIYRVIFISSRRNRRIRFGSYTSMPYWAVLFYMAPITFLMFWNVFFNYSCGYTDFQDKKIRFMTLLTSYIIPLLCYGACRTYIGRKIRTSPRSRVLMLRYKMTMTSLSVIRMVFYLGLRTPDYVCDLIIVNSAFLAISTSTDISCHGRIQ